MEHFHRTFAEFQSAIEETLNGVLNVYADDLVRLMSLSIQQFENVSLLTA
jgi:phosphotransferase system HPr-like phosphotransfer protein